MFDLAGRRVFVAGHRGMVGQALLRRLAREDCTLLTIDRAGLDLRAPDAVSAWFAANRPQAVFVAAGTVGGILANDSRPAEFLLDNLLIATSVIEAARQSRVEKLLYLGSSCIYPRLAPQPIPETALLTGPLEPTNEAYALAKIAGLKLCTAYRRQYGLDFTSAMPTNLYGPHDTYDARGSHVIPALLLKFHLARRRGDAAVEIWGTGTPRREFLHVDDLADALVFLMRHHSGPDPVNVGWGEDVSIEELAGMVRDVTGFTGDLLFDPTMPDGMPRKLLDTRRLNALGWRPSIRLRDGLEDAYRWFIANAAPAIG